MQSLVSTKWIFWIKWLLSLCLSCIKHGVHLYSLLDALTRIQKDKIAVIIDDQSIPYSALKQRTDQLIHLWNSPENSPLLPQQIGLLLQQNLDGLASLFALSRLGKDIIILNPNLVIDKLHALIKQKQLYLIGNLTTLNQLQVKNSFAIPTVQDLAQDQQYSLIQAVSIRPYYFNKISVCSSGSTGVPKVATRKSNPLQSLPLLDLLLRKLKFLKIQKIFVMTPICHAAGLTASLMAFSFNKTVILQQRFNAKTASQLIEQHQIDSLNLVPTILYRLLASNAPLKPVKYIISGSAPLSRHLILQLVKEYSNIQLFNLYGSSETGINLFATPDDLKSHPESIGKAIKGVEVKITDHDGNILAPEQIGTLWTKCAWSIQPNQWMHCGDLAMYDQHGYFYLKGRQDDMLICGGINVYPIDLENILYQHSAIQYAQAYAISDHELGQSLAVNIICKSPIEIAELHDWISDHAPRYLRPKTIQIIENITTDSIGKPIQ